MQRNLVIFSSGEGTGAENLVRRLPGRTLAIVSNHENGGVRRRADILGVPFVYFSGPYTEEGYSGLIERICLETKVDESELWYALSGWFRWVYWLSPARTFNIHPAPLPRFAGIYGENLHKAVWEAYKMDDITEGEIVMQFVTPESPLYDDGPIFFRHAFDLSGIENYEDYREVVRILEHNFQPILTQAVLDGVISWDGVHPESLKTAFL